MAALMWRMNGLWRRMAGVLVLCALLLSNEVMCQDIEGADPTAGNQNALDPTATTAAASPAASDVIPTTAGSTINTQPTTTTVPLKPQHDNPDGDNTVVHYTFTGINVTSPDGASKQEVKEGTKGEMSPGSSSTSSGSSVFVGILVTGLLAALAITVGYFKCQRRTDTKGVKLAEEAYPVDQENQGNTLVSVAPLNPPPENQEKPSINGESTEPAKTEPPPPTNGHSTTKTADTEL